VTPATIVALCLLGLIIKAVSLAILWNGLNVAIITLTIIALYAVVAWIEWRRQTLKEKTPRARIESSRAQPQATSKGQVQRGAFCEIVLAALI
jgi:hypothetical protein